MPASSSPSPALPCTTVPPGFKTKYDNVNVVTIRENTEGEYSGLEHEVQQVVVIQRATRRVCQRTCLRQRWRTYDCSPTAASACRRCRCHCVAGQVIPGVVENIKVITRTASERIAQYAFAYARANGRSRVTVVHKADLMKLVDGLFLDCCREAAVDYPDIKFEEMLIDNAILQVCHARFVAVLSCGRGRGRCCGSMQVCQR
jgi:isocitrate dehydrogenase (NAD+)